MTEYIDRDEAIDRIKSNHCGICRNNDNRHNNWHCRECEYHEVIGELEDLPSLPERKKGKWNRTELYPHRIYCSVCYKTYIKNDKLLERWEFPMNYCPNCGAEMEGVE